MAFAADQVRLSTQSNARSGDVVRFIWHHQAGTNDDGTIGAMVSGSRQVSATWTVSNTGRVTSVVPEDRRPWTSASYADDGALTVECANSSGPPDYGISDASHEACARLARYAFEAHGVPLQRATAANGWRGHMGHNEVVGAFGDGYATACPMHLDIDRILTLASGGSHIGGGALSEEDTFMPKLTDDQQVELYDRTTKVWQMIAGGLVNNDPQFRQMYDRVNYNFENATPAVLGALQTITQLVGSLDTAGGATAEDIVKQLGEAITKGTAA